MIFQFMDKYRLPILVFLLLGLVGFGVWSFVADSFGGGPAIDLGEVVASYEIGGETFEVTRAEYETQRQRTYQRNDLDETEKVAAVVARDMRDRLVDVTGIGVTDDELKSALESEIKEPLEQRNGRFDRADYVALVNLHYRMTPEDFERAFRDDLRVAKLVNEIERVNTLVPVEEIYDLYQKVFSKVKLGGVFFHTADFEEAAKLEKDEDGDLTEEAREKLVAWWRDLSEDAKRRFNKEGALIDADVIGFRFAGKSDEELTALLESESAISGTSLQELTADFVPDEDVLAKLKLRLDRNRETYGVAADAELDAAFEEKKDRLVAEWKILNLLDRVHDEVRTALTEEGRDLEEIARANNLEFHAYRGQPIQRLREGDEYPGTFSMQLPALEANTVLDWTPPLGPNVSSFFAGPVDEPGKHASIWVVRGKDLNPIPALIDVHDEAVAAYETERAVALRDEAFEAFEARIDAWLEEKIAAEATRIREEARQAIEERVAGLDPVEKADEIAAIEKEENDKAELLIEEEKEPFRSEAFRAAMEAVAADDASKAIVVEEGYFLPSSARTERAVDAKSGTTEAMARSALRKEFQSLQDNVFNDDLVEPGELGETLESRTYSGLKGRAIVIDKKVPSVEEMLLHPERMSTIETSYIPALRNRKAQKKSMWSWEHLRRDDTFGLEADPLMKQIEEERERERQIEADIEKARRAREAGAPAGTEERPQQ